MKTEIKKEKKQRRHKRVRAKVSGSADRPRLCVFRSAKHIYAQLINDEKEKILISASDKDLKTKTQSQKVRSSAKEGKSEETKPLLAGKAAVAYEVGELIAKKAIENKIERVVFDRGGYKYHGRVKALADGAREAGLKF